MRCVNIDHSNLIGKPIESLQTFLREITFYYEDLPKVIPDGIFGEQTKTAVESFQTKFELEVTGIVDLITWDKIIEVYYDVLEKTTVEGSVFLNDWFVIEPFESSGCLEVMQSMMKCISNKYTNMGTLEITGVHDEQSVAMVKKFQEIFGHEQTGIIDNVLWQKIERFYIHEIVNNVFE